MPRTLEWLIAFFLLIAFSPLFLLLMVAIMLDSPGWPMFYQRRVGINGTYFWMIKFRKMHNSVPQDGKGITTQNDIRLTRVGRILERFKLDELPQILNVLRGDMALVGPRPEIPKFTHYYPDKWKTVLSVRPGIVGYSQVVTPHENDLYPLDCYDHEKYYLEQILPSKLNDEIHYIQQRSFRLDLSILFRVALSLATKTINRRWIAVRLSHAFMLLSDTVISLFSMIMSFFIVYQSSVQFLENPTLNRVLMISLLIRPVCFLIFGLHRYPISSTITLTYLLKIVIASFYSSLLLIVVLMFSDKRDLVLSAHMVDLFVLPSLLISSRIIYIVLHDSILAAQSLSSLKKALFHFLILLCYGGIGFFSFWMSHILRLNEFNINLLMPKLGFVSLCALAIRMSLSIFLWPPRARTWRGFLGREIPRIVNISFIGTGFILIVYLALQEQAYSRVALALDFSFNIVFSSFLYLIWCIPQIHHYELQKPKKIVIVGVGVEAELLISTLQRIDSETWKVIGIVTDIDWKRYASISGIRVIGTIPDLPSLFELHHPDLLITWEWIQKSNFYEFIEQTCEKYKVKLSISPSIGTLLSVKDDVTDSVVIP